MKFHINPVIWVAIGVNCLCLATVTTAVVSKRMSSDNEITERAKGLNLVAQHFKADTCWISKDKKPFKLGDEIDTPGSLKGKLPTSCIKSIKTGQILQVAYSEGKLIVSQIYSKTELRNQLSILKEQGNSNDETQRKKR
ncbi:hypothetical protein [Nostoc sp. 'Peltigera membranacea cyanobiont' 232]|uniref:hypothetical protein n=1 Tax=Nostoc sp. 'Peltigera membranacea cyanobiont' 232 TaxID=2014531 RepID=UPI000B95755D|nr:hypothetical protein [Nostoc sp. 'Peltigera membranacea cyanobiont' 232]OYE02790.1 hypothetical protein CDG79_21940 [Nostoc sp. 'Peltigera membranacea cyanobiont' 232]